ncbi:RNA methyltransferase [Leptolyngbya valderiana BDU 20041]|nr:RNA methyltransferase [Leptolyngbya valderiana BDU 20041]
MIRSGMELTALSQIAIVLVEPAGALNVGSIARVMANMGLYRLVLVNPQCDHLGDEARQMAVHAAEILENAQCVDSLPSALQGCQRVVATAGRDRSFPTHFEHPREVLPWLLEVPSSLVFGREDRGLSNEELNYAQRFLRIPSSPNYASLNLAQSVAVCAYELYDTVVRAEADSPNLPPETDDPEATADAIEAYYRDFEKLLLDIGYLYPHTAKARMEKFRRLYNRVRLSQTEVAMLRGLVRQMEWAISQTSSKSH